MILTRTQLEALAYLHKQDQLPYGHGRMSYRFDGLSVRFSRRTLEALVAADVARRLGGAYVRVVEVTSSAGVLLPDRVENHEQAARAILTGELWRRYPQAYIDDARVRSVRWNGAGWVESDQTVGRQVRREVGKARVRAHSASLCVLCAARPHDPTCAIGALADIAEATRQGDGSPESDGPILDEIGKILTRAGAL